MILVDIKVPAMDSTYDFRVDENIPVEQVLQEVVDMVCQKERCIVKGRREDFLLCADSGNYVLNGKWTLKECNVKSGQELLLI